jgi:hypothetical protein
MTVHKMAPSAQKATPFLTLSVHLKLPIMQRHELYYWPSTIKAIKSRRCDDMSMLYARREDKYIEGYEW